VFEKDLYNLEGRFLEGCIYTRDSIKREFMVFSFLCFFFLFQLGMLHCSLHIW